MRASLPPYTYAFACERLSVAPASITWLTPALHEQQYVPPVVRVVAIELLAGYGSRAYVPGGNRARLFCESIATKTAMLDTAFHSFSCLILPVGWRVLWSELTFAVRNQGTAGDVATINVYARSTHGGAR